MCPAPSGPSGCPANAKDDWRADMTRSRPTDDPGPGPGTRPVSVPMAGFRRAHPSALPVTGAWRPGDPSGGAGSSPCRRAGRSPSRAGACCTGRTVAYETWGELAPDAGNAVLVCHALTGDSHAAGGLDPGHPDPGLVGRAHRPGPGARHRPLLRRVRQRARRLPGHRPGPRRPHPDDGRPWGSRFPVVSIRDMVRTQAAVADHLGIARWLPVVGRVDGRHAGPRVGRHVPRPGAARSSRSPPRRPPAPSRSAGGAAGRRAIRMDPRWRGGDYYDAAPGDGPHDGLAMARMISRSRSAATTCSPPGSGGRWSSPSTASRCGSGSRSSATSSTTATSWSAGSTPTATSCSPRPWTSTTSPGAAAASRRRSPGCGAPCCRWASRSDILYPPHQQREIARAGRPTPACRRATSRSTARTATTPS